MMAGENESVGVWHTQTDDQMCDAESLNLLEDSSGLQDWTVPATFSALFCFLPTGIIAIYSSLKAKKSKVQKDYKGWKKYNGQARFFVFLTVLVGVFVYAIIIGVLQSISHNQNDS